MGYQDDDGHYNRGSNRDYGGHRDYDRRGGGGGGYRNDRRRRSGEAAGLTTTATTRRATATRRRRTDYGGGGGGGPKLNAAPAVDMGAASSSSCSSSSAPRLKTTDAEIPSRTTWTPSPGPSPTRSSTTAAASRASSGAGVVETDGDRGLESLLRRLADAFDEPPASSAARDRADLCAGLVAAAAAGAPGGFVPRSSATPRRARRPRLRALDAPATSAPVDSLEALVFGLRDCAACRFDAVDVAAFDAPSPLRRSRGVHGARLGVLRVRRAADLDGAAAPPRRAEFFAHFLSNTKFAWPYWSYWAAVADEDGPRRSCGRLARGAASFTHALAPLDDAELSAALRNLVRDDGDCEAAALDALADVWAASAQHVALLADALVRRGVVRCRAVAAGSWTAQRVALGGSTIGASFKPHELLQVAVDRSLDLLSAAVASAAARGPTRRRTAS
ncbi:hypothetical protein JL722_13875 [Aureococcus anophagefferens]|nr:hypothetical protein JL722_13875 [Aureococcus anophagefferens]